MNKYVYYVECKIGSNTWLTSFLVTCDSIDKILPMLEHSGLDNVTAYGQPKDPNINIHSVQKLARCSGDGPSNGFIQLYRVFCDIKPNGTFD